MYLHLFLPSFLLYNEIKYDRIKARPNALYSNAGRSYADR